MFPRMYDAVAYVFSSYAKAKSVKAHGLDRDTRQPWHTRTLLDRLGSPDRQQRSIKVTGSKGKGSTARSIASFLQAQGLRVGLFTSPHLVDYTERIRVDGHAIEEADFMRILWDMKPIIDEMQAAFAPGAYFGPVGIAAAVAMMYFQACATDVNVIELGRGARFDDVNQVHGEISVITPIYLEHASYLGPSLHDVAYSKAGILTEGVRTAITATQTPDVLSVIADEAARYGIPVLVGEREFSATDVQIEKDGTRCTLRTPSMIYEKVALGLHGRHQAQNASVALMAAEAFLGEPLTSAVVHRGATLLRWIGRCHIIESSPSILIDGAINAEGAEYLREVILARATGPVTLVAGVPSDKDYHGFFKMLGPAVGRIYTTKAQNQYLTFPDDAVAVAEQYAPASAYPSLAEAIAEAERTSPPEGMIVIAGTQSLVADALSYFRIDTRHLV